MKRTDLKNYMMTLQGGQYLKVPGRILAFREEHPNGQILTEMTQFDLSAGWVCFKATIVVDGLTLATAYGSETQRSFPQGWFEKAETVAVGRALAQAGFGTAYALADFHESEENKLADAPASNRKLQPPAPQPPAPRPAPSAVPTEKEHKIKEMFAKAKETGVSNAQLKAMLAERGYPTSSADLAVEQIDLMIGLMSQDF